MTIPATIHASAALAHGDRHEGELALKLLPRLSQVLLPGSSRLRVWLEASNASGYARLTGEVGGELMLECRRCGKPCTWTLALRVDLRLVTSEAEEKRALHDAEPYRIEDDTLPLREIVEDEVLLALPMLPRCAACENEVQDAVPDAAPPEVEAEGPRRDNPFAALKGKLKK